MTTTVSDQEIAKGVETLLRQSDPNVLTTLNGVVQQLEAKLGLDLSHKAGFIRDQINLILRQHPQSLPQKDHFALQHQFPNSYHVVHQQPPESYPHFVFQQPQQHYPQHPLPPSQFRVQQQTSPPSPAVVKSVGSTKNAAANASETSKGSASAGTKRRGGAGGLNKVCSVSPELQAVVGEAALPRTEIVKQLWAYIRKHNLQDPSNKRKIICDDALRLVFETDSTDMFKMNKLLSKHIMPLDPTKQSIEAKRLKVETDSTSATSVVVPSPMIISDALAKFFGTSEKEMLQTEATNRVWEYIKVNNLEDRLNPMAILCDAKLQELLGCESISAIGVPEILARHHLFKQ
ncbi:hypothetical protein M9H77_13274 [Catharanthus roseus]|uniref:Uncharacterized protein n=1 Tax=Catharanthus roseus TaxID=4058 RepID=A0ACC0BJR9_CATRO|nr:hypothetical protein M9H77_13274 [Catharanthus roseus]